MNGYIVEACVKSLSLDEAIVEYRQTYAEALAFLKHNFWNCLVEYRNDPIGAYEDGAIARFKIVCSNTSAVDKVEISPEGRVAFFGSASFFTEIEAQLRKQNSENEAQDF